MLFRICKTKKMSYESQLQSFIMHQFGVNLK